MKFQDMPYERIDFAKVQEEMGELIRELEASRTEEEAYQSVLNCEFEVL